MLVTRTRGVDVKPKVLGRTSWGAVPKRERESRRAFTQNTKRTLLNFDLLLSPAPVYVCRLLHIGCIRMDIDRCLHVLGA
jgi:hypothetical protein